MPRLPLAHLGPAERARQLAEIVAPPVRGRILELTERLADVVGLDVGVGDLVTIGDGHGGPPVPAEIVAIHGERAVALPFGSLRGHRCGDPVLHTGRQLDAPVGEQLLGRVLDGMGQPMDDLGPLHTERVGLHLDPPPALSRPIVERPLLTGVRVIDTMLSCGRGQRVAILAGSGVGKSSLLSMLVRSSDADVNVACLVGERGREVAEFINHDLGPEGLARTVVIVATSDAPALVRRNAAFLATRIAEWFRDSGRDVNLVMDSVTRFAMAQREIGLAAGEVPTTRGYPPSVFGLLPTLLERAGTSAHGSITGFYTVLVEGDDLNDPIGDSVRSILDGHISLSRDLANAGHFPSIDVLQSASRVAKAVTTDEQRRLATRARALLATHDSARDLLEVGAYTAGTDPQIDQAVELHGPLVDFCRQDLAEATPGAQAWQRLAAIVDRSAAMGGATFGAAGGAAGPSAGASPVAGFAGSGGFAAPGNAAAAGGTPAAPGMLVGAGGRR